MEPISSVHNPLVKHLQKLKRRRFREQEGRFVIEGVRFVEEALGSGWPVESLFFSPELLKSSRGSRLLDAAGRGNIKTVPVDKSVLDGLASTESPQGALALCRMKNTGLEEVIGAGGGREVKQDALLVVADGVSDPGNLGTIVRSAHAFGADGAVLLKGTVDLFNEKTLRSTMGSVFHLPAVHNVTASVLQDHLSAVGMALVVGVPRGGLPLDRLDAVRPLALVVGSEATGPSSDIYAIPHQKVTIPMPGGAESLNAAVAASIMLYQICRLRGR